MSVPWGGRGCLLAGGRYRLVEQAGFGGMAVVWRAVDTVLNRDVAIKVLNADTAGNVSADLLKAEAQAIAQLNHPHVTSVHDFGQEMAADGTLRPFVVMELLEGPTLQQMLADGKPLSPAQATTVAAQVASALAYAHSRGIVHRDISCGNIILTDEGAKVLDFGIAGLLGQPDSSLPGELMGTPAYVAPERIRSADTAVTAAMDVYAFGIVWYRTLSGRMPWTAHSATGLIQSHLIYTPSSLPPIGGLPEQLRELCMSCLIKDPLQRPTSGHLAHTLAEFVRPTKDPYQTTRAVNISEQTLALGSALPHRNRVLLIAGAAVVLAAVGLVGAAAPGWLRQPAGQVLPPPATSAATPSPVTPVFSAATAGASTTSATTGKGGHVVNAAGGSVRVSCDRDTAGVINVAPAPGYAIKDQNRGPADEVQIVFISTVNESEIKIRCHDGIPNSKIKESPQ